MAMRIKTATTQAIIALNANGIAIRHSRHMSTRNVRFISGEPDADFVSHFCHVTGQQSQVTEIRKTPATKKKCRAELLPPPVANIRRNASTDRVARNGMPSSRTNRLSMLFSFDTTFAVVEAALLTG